MMSTVVLEHKGGILKRFVKWNYRISNFITPRLFRDSEGAAYYNRLVRDIIQHKHPSTVVDIGAGGHCWYVDDELRKACKFKLIGQDVDARELLSNTSIDERVVCDASETIGVPDGTVDLIVSHFAIEHIPNNSGFISASHRALKVGGRFVCVFQGKWAPSSILNRMLPEKLTKKLLLSLVPGSDGVLGFEAHYDKCAHSEFKAALEQQGFTIEDEYNSYYNSNYFAFFVPLYIIGVAGDYIRMLIGNRDLATQCVFCARKVR